MNFHIDVHHLHVHLPPNPEAKEIREMFRILVLQGKTMHNDISGLQAALQALVQKVQTQSTTIASFGGTLAENNATLSNLVNAVLALPGTENQQAAIDALTEMALAAQGTLDNNTTAIEALQTSLASAEDVADDYVFAEAFVDRAAFDAALANFKGLNTVGIDGLQVKEGVGLTLSYFTHSADGHIDRTGPTD